MYWLMNGDLPLFTFWMYCPPHFGNGDSRRFVFGDITLCGFFMFRFLGIYEWAFGERFGLVLLARIHLCNFLDKTPCRVEEHEN